MSNVTRRATTFYDLPPEVISSVLAHCDLLTALQFVQTSANIRKVSQDSSVAWTSILESAAYDAHLLQRATYDVAPTWEAGEALGSAAGYSALPARAYLPLLPILVRQCIPYLELPRLTNEEWKGVCEQRFGRGVLKRETQRCEVVQAGRWKTVYTKLISRYEHRSRSFCTEEQRNCHYVILHRTFGLSRNRIGSRQFDAERVFSELKRENSLRDYTTLRIEVPPSLTPIDIQVSVYVTLGRRGAFLTNHTIQHLLTALGAVWPDTGALLGPALITAFIRPPPNAGEFAPAAPVSLEVEDLWQIASLVGLDQEWWDSVVGSTVKDGFGYS